MNVDTQLRQGARQLGLSLSEKQTRQLLDYLALMKKWNRVYNLTAIPEEESVSHHLLDSLAVLPYLDSGALLDVGSGAGLPGIPLAIGNPALPVTVLDSNTKKAAFMRQAVGELGLANVSVCSQRIQDWRPDSHYVQIISRAYAELRDFVVSCAHALAPGGHLLAMKGQLPQDEIDRLPGGFALKRVERLHVPGLDAERHLLWIAAS